MGTWDKVNEALRKHQEDMFVEDEPLEKAEALEKKRHAFRNQAATPRPKGFRYVRQALGMPVAVAGLVRRGKVVGKGEPGAGKGEASPGSLVQAETPEHPTLPGEAAEAARMERRLPRPAPRPKTPASSLNMRWYREQQAKIPPKAPPARVPGKK